MKVPNRTRKRERMARWLDAEIGQPSTASAVLVRVAAAAGSPVSEQARVFGALPITVYGAGRGLVTLVPWQLQRAQVWTQLALWRWAWRDNDGTALRAPAVERVRVLAGCLPRLPEDWLRDAEAAGVLSCGGMPRQGLRASGCASESSCE